MRESDKYSIVINTSFWKDVHVQTEKGLEEDYELVSEHVENLEIDAVDEVVAYSKFLEKLKEIKCIYEREVLLDKPHHHIAYTNTMLEYMPHPNKLYHVELRKNGEPCEFHNLDFVMQSSQLERLRELLDVNKTTNKAALERYKSIFIALIENKFESFNCLNSDSYYVGITTDSKSGEYEIVFIDNLTGNDRELIQSILNPAPIKSVMELYYDESLHKEGRAGIEISEFYQITFSSIVENIKTNEKCLLTLAILMNKERSEKYLNAYSISLTDTD